jgi:hypothetical protein
MPRKLQIWKNSVSAPKFILNWAKLLWKHVKCLGKDVMEACEMLEVAFVEHTVGKNTYFLVVSKIEWCGLYC